MYKVKIGGTMRVMGGRADGWMHRVEVWMGLDSDRARQEIVGDADPKTRQELLMKMIEKSQIFSDLPGNMESIHNDICRLYVHRVSQWVLREPGQLAPDPDINCDAAARAGLSHRAWVEKRYNERAHAMKFWISDCAKLGANYRDPSWLLKNMRFTGWAPNHPGENTAGCPKINAGPYNEFKGFCQEEPVARFRQLLAFPIEKFGISELPQIEWVQPPAALTGSTGADHVEGSRALQAELRLWEEYYNRLVGQFGELSLEIERLINDQPARNDG